MATLTPPPATRPVLTCPLGHGPLEFITTFDGEDSYECGKCSVCMWLPAALALPLKTS